MSITITAEELAPGVVIFSHDTHVTILREPEPWKDMFGREMCRAWAKRWDNQAEGWYAYGPLGTFVLCPDECPRCGYRLNRDGYPHAHQSTVDGRMCEFTWEPID